MITFDDNILDKRFTDKAKSLQNNLKEVGMVFNKIDTDELFKVLTNLENTK